MRRGQQPYADGATSRRVVRTGRWQGCILVAAVAAIAAGGVLQRRTAIARPGREDLSLNLVSGLRTTDFDHAVIAAAATNLGIPRHRVEEVLASDEYADAVRADEAQARRIGVTGAPFALFGTRTAIPGAASSEGCYARAIEQE